MINEGTNMHIKEIKHYTIVGKIDSGGWATVYDAIDTRSNFHVALKIFSKSKVSREYLNEVTSIYEMVKPLKHRNIVAFFDLFEDNDYLYIAEELCEGVNLRNYVCMNGCLKDTIADSIFMEITRGVRFLRKNNIAHCDIKLENVIYNTKTKRIKIIDFGFARKIKPGQKIKSDRCSIPYAAPELLRREKFDPCIADVWSLGVVYYTLHMGQYPFSAATSQELVVKILNGEYEIPQCMQADTAQLISKLLCTNVESRVNLEILYEELKKKFLPKTSSSCIGGMLHTRPTKCNTIIKPFKRRSSALRALDLKMISYRRPPASVPP